MHKLESVNFYNNAAATTAAAAAFLHNQRNNTTSSTAPSRDEDTSDEHSPSVQRMSPCGTGEGSQASSGSPVSGSKGSGDEGSGGTPGDLPAGSSRRKGKAFKLDRIALRLQAGRISTSPSAPNSEEPDTHEVMDVQAPEPQDETGVEQNEVGMETAESVVSNAIQGSSAGGVGGQDGGAKSQSVQAAYEALSAIAQQQPGNRDLSKTFDGGNKGAKWEKAYVCDHCEIAFLSQVMYHIHMGYHGYDNPFRCNRCGQMCQDSLGMFMHIAQAKH